MILFIKEEYLLNFIVLCSHYSTRYVNAENYCLQRNDSFKKEIYFSKNNTKDEIVSNFISKYTEEDALTVKFIQPICYFYGVCFLKKK